MHKGLHCSQSRVCALTKHSRVTVKQTSLHPPVPVSSVSHSTRFLAQDSRDVRAQAAVNYDPPTRRKDFGARQDSADKAERDTNRYVPLDEAREIIRRAVNESAPEPAKILPFCETGAQVYT